MQPTYPVYGCVYPQANTNEIVLASTHDVQEVDVSALLAAQPYTWIGEEFDKESRTRSTTSICSWVSCLQGAPFGVACAVACAIACGWVIPVVGRYLTHVVLLVLSSDDTDYRSSHTNIAQASAPPLISASPSMPWLGSGQTSTGANVVRGALWC